MDRRFGLSRSRKQMDLRCDKSTGSWITLLLSLYFHSRSGTFSILNAPHAWPTGHPAGRIASSRTPPTCLRHSLISRKRTDPVGAKLSERCCKNGMTMSELRRLKDLEAENGGSIATRRIRASHPKHQTPEQFAPARRLAKTQGAQPPERLDGGAPAPIARKKRTGATCAGPSKRARVTDMAGMSVEIVTADTRKRG
jgi:hypothetical protein